MVEYFPLSARFKKLPMGARLMVGRLTLDQLVEVRILCPQPDRTLSRERVLIFRWGHPFDGELKQIKGLIHQQSNP